MLVCDKIYNMEHEPSHIPSERVPEYAPEELGLDYSNEADKELYIESRGIREAGELLIERRKLENARAMGEISPEHYDMQRSAFDDVLGEIFGDNQKEAP